MARKLALRPNEIVDFLAAQKIQIEEGSNTRLHDEHVNLILKHLAPDMLKEVEAEMAVDPEDEITIPSITVENELEPNNMEVEDLADQTLGNEITLADVSTEASLLASQQAEQLEVIRAPKVELPGLKVIGKIEIPEPKKKEVPLNDDSVEKNIPTPEQEGKPTHLGKRLPQKQRVRDDRPRRNPITIQREREAMEQEQKRREDAKREKEKRTLNYLKKVKATQPVKPVRLVNEQVVEMSAELNDTRTTWWGRFKKWLTS